MPVLKPDRARGLEARRGEAQEFVEESAAVRVASALWHELKPRFARAKRRAGAPFAHGANIKRPFAAVGKAAVNNLDLAPEAVVALAENDIDRLRITGRDTRRAPPRGADRRKAILKQSVHGTMIPHHGGTSLPATFPSGRAANASKLPSCPVALTQKRSAKFQRQVFSLTVLVSRSRSQNASGVLPQASAVCVRVCGGKRDLTAAARRGMLCAGRRGPWV